MASVLKFSQNSPSPAPERQLEPQPFNAQDIEQRAQKYLDQVRAEAQAILEQARQEAEELRRQSKQQGLQAAEEHFEQRVLEEAQRLSEQRCHSAVAACSATVLELNSATAEWLAEWRDQTVELAARIAEKILRHQLEANTTETLKLWLEEAMRVMQDAQQVRVLVNPEDHVLAGRCLRQLAKSAMHIPNCELVPDPTVATGGCLVQSAAGQIDYQLETQLDRLVEQLS